MPTSIARLDDWLRTSFVVHNTALEERYFAAGVEFSDDPDLADHKRAILHEGAALAGAIETLPDAADDRYELLGMVGYVLGACRRHEVEDASLLAPVWAIAERLGASLGVAPRYVFAHQAFWNTARGGSFRTFTSLVAESRFVELNAIGVLGYARAAEALRRIPMVGVSSPVASVLFDQARAALEDVLEANQRIARDVPIDRFFRCIRPYFKSHRVGASTWRGANAGDFSAINEIDVLLGLADPADPFYAGVLAEKRPYVPPGDRPALDDLAGVRSLRARFEAEAGPDPGAADPALRANAVRFLAVCRAHAAAYSFHHHALVRPFLERPAAAIPAERAAAVSASGPPLSEVIASLERLLGLRTARAPLASIKAIAGA